MMDARRTAEVPLDDSAEPLGEVSFTRIFVRYYDDLVRYVHRRIRDLDTAEDIVQETFLRAYRARDRYDAARDVWPWLATISANLVANKRRDDMRRRSHIRWDLAWDDVVARTVDGTDLDPQKRFDRREHDRSIAVALHTLPNRSRRILLQRTVEHLSYARIAEAEGVSVNAVRAVVKRARHALRATIHEPGD